MSWYPTISTACHGTRRAVIHLGEVGQLQLWIRARGSDAERQILSQRCATRRGDQDKNNCATSDLGGNSMGRDSVRRLCTELAVVVLRTTRPYFFRVSLSSLSAKPSKESAISGTELARSRQPSFRPWCEILRLDAG